MKGIGVYILCTEGGSLAIARRQPDLDCRCWMGGRR